MNLDKEMDYLIKCAEQRAFLMKMLKIIFQEQDQDKYGDNTRNLCFKILVAMMHNQSMVRDDIDMDVLKMAKTVCEQEVFLEDMKNILNEND